MKKPKIPWKGKGSWQRKMAVSYDEFAENWERALERNKNNADLNAKCEAIMQQLDGMDFSTPKQMMSMARKLCRENDVMFSELILFNQYREKHNGK